MGESPTESMEWPQQFSTSSKMGPRTLATGIHKYWTSWLLENQLADLPTLTYLDASWRLGTLIFIAPQGFLLSNVPFSLCTGFAWCLTYSLIYMAWTLVHFFAKIGTPQPCTAYPQNDGGIMT
eukprot:Skav230937  [mRNA]  locus=scaffold2774:134217:137600:- [translate_table: standard]